VKVAPGVSLREIADVVGVSVSTVSRALNDSDRVSAITKRAVRGAIADLTANGRSGTVDAPTRPMLGLTHSHLSGGNEQHSLDNIVEQVQVGIEIACLRAGYIPFIWQQSRLLTTAEGDPFFEAVSGVVMSGGLVEHALVAAITARGLPVVTIGGHVPDTTTPSVAADSQRGLYLATRHLLGLGHRRVALVNGPAETYTSFEKRAGYLAALFEAGIPAEPSLVRARDGYAGFNAVIAEALTEELFALPDPPTAILYAGDQMAEAGYRVCQRRGLRIPEDISIVGFHDDPDARHAQPAMTTVRVDRVRWGEAAADRLLRAIGGEALPGSRLLLPVELIVRASTGPAPARGPVAPRGGGT
jgi:LacI family transcriptional regulator